MQRGFMEGCSSVNAAFILMECIAEAKDSQETLLVTMLNASKAFSVVAHNLLMCLERQGGGLSTGQYVSLTNKSLVVSKDIHQFGH